MGKGHKHSKKVKAEKAKVKLKGSQTLPKGTNVTDTSFKIKQIVIREQLKTANEAEPLSKRKLNIKELLSRLQHYNTTVKNDAINDLKDIVNSYPVEVVIPNLGQLLPGISHLVLDKEKTVRREALKLIAVLLTQVSVEQISPFFDILSAYFRCAMTHIDLSIQEDSLFLLDTLLSCTPSLVAEHSNKILENFFDLISKLRTDSKPGRTLTVNLNSKITTVKWRIKVLHRLYSLLNAILTQKKGTSTNDNQQLKKKLNIIYEPEIKFYPVYHSNYLVPPVLNINNENINQNTDENNIIKYIDILIPLLFETWLEVGPNDKNENKDIDITLTEEATSVLNCILNILLLLHKFLILNENDTGDFQKMKDFNRDYSRDFTNYIFSHFPYMKISSKKRKRSSKFNESRSEVQCVTENLIICNIFCIFNKNTAKNDKNQKDNIAKMLNYVQKILTNWIPENEQENMQTFLILKHLLLESSSSLLYYEADLLKILKFSVNLYSNKKLNESIKLNLFNILCEVVHLNYLNKLPEFQMWLTTLPELLCQNEISENTVDIILKLIKQNNKLFNNSLKNLYNNILDKLENIKILNASDEITTKCKILGFAYYLSNENYLNYFNIILKSNCDNTLKKYFQEILILKFEELNDLENVEKLRNIAY